MDVDVDVVNSPARMDPDADDGDIKWYERTFSSELLEVDAAGAHKAKLESAAEADVASMRASGMREQRHIMEISSQPPTDPAHVSMDPRLHRIMQAAEKSDAAPASTPPSSPPQPPPIAKPSSSQLHRLDDLPAPSPEMDAPSNASGKNGGHGHKLSALGLVSATLGVGPLGLEFCKVPAAFDLWYIDRIDPSSQAAACHKLVPGLLLLSVNGQSVGGMDRFESVRSLLVTAKRPVTLLFRPPPSQWAQEQRSESECSSQDQDSTSLQAAVAADATESALSSDAGTSMLTTTTAATTLPTAATTSAADKGALGGALAAFASASASASARTLRWGVSALSKTTKAADRSGGGSDAPSAADGETDVNRCSDGQSDADDEQPRDRSAEELQALRAQLARETERRRQAELGASATLSGDSDVQKEENEFELVRKNLATLRAMMIAVAAARTGACAALEAARSAIFAASEAATSRPEQTEEKCSDDHGEPDAESIGCGNDDDDDDACSGGIAGESDAADGRGSGNDTASPSSGENSGPAHDLEAQLDHERKLRAQAEAAVRRSLKLRKATVEKAKVAEAERASLEESLRDEIKTSAARTNDLENELRDRTVEFAEMAESVQQVQQEALQEGRAQAQAEHEAERARAKTEHDEDCTREREARLQAEQRAIAAVAEAQQQRELCQQAEDEATRASQALHRARARGADAASELRRQRELASASACAVALAGDLRVAAEAHAASENAWDELRWAQRLLVRGCEHARADARSTAIESIRNNDNSEEYGGGKKCLAEPHQSVTLHARATELEVVLNTNGSFAYHGGAPDEALHLWRRRVRRGRHARARAQRHTSAAHDAIGSSWRKLHGAAAKPAVEADAAVCEDDAKSCGRELWLAHAMDEWLADRESGGSGGVGAVTVDARDEEEATAEGVEEHIAGSDTMQAARVELARLREQLTAKMTAKLAPPEPDTAGKCAGGSDACSAHVDLDTVSVILAEHEKLVRFGPSVAQRLGAGAAVAAATEMLRGALDTETALDAPRAEAADAVAEVLELRTALAAEQHKRHEAELRAETAAAGAEARVVAAVTAVQERAAREVEAAHERARRSADQHRAAVSMLEARGANISASSTVASGASARTGAGNAPDRQSPAENPAAAKALAGAATVREDALKRAADSATQRLWQAQAQLTEALRSNALVQAELATTRASAEQARTRERQAQSAAREAQKEARQANKRARRLAATQNEIIRKHVQRAVARAAVDRERLLVRVRADIEAEMRAVQSKSDGEGAKGLAVARDTPKELSEPRGTTLMI